MKVCIDLGATNIKGARMEKGQIVVEACSPTGHGSREAVVASLTRAIEGLLAPGTDAIAIASAGDIDEACAVCTYATPNLEGFTGFDFVAYAWETFGLRCTAINDARAALLGEMCDGAGKNIRDRRVIMLTLGSGVGGAYWTNGSLAGSPANDYARFGHYCLEEGGIPCNCGRRGCIEQYLSGRALNRMARERGLQPEGYLLQAKEGDRTACAMAADLVRLLDRALLVIANRCPFDVCILGGGVAEGIAQSRPSLLSELSFPAVFAALGNRAGLFGAYRFAEGKA